MGNSRAGRTQADFGHGIFELEAVFCLVNRLRRRANQLDFVFFENAVVPKIQRTVQRRLPPHGRKDGVWFFFDNDFFNGLPRDGFNVGDVCRGRVGHDGGRVAVDQNNLVAFFAQGFAGLHAGIIKLAGLSNNDGPRANDQDAFNIGTFWHFLCNSLLFFSAAHRALQTFFKTRPSWHWPTSNQTKQTAPQQHSTGWRINFFVSESLEPMWRP